MQHHRRRPCSPLPSILIIPQAGLVAIPILQIRTQCSVRERGPGSPPGFQQTLRYSRSASPCYRVHENRGGGGRLVVLSSQKLSHSLFEVSGHRLQPARPSAAPHSYRLPGAPEPRFYRSLIFLCNYQPALRDLIPKLRKESDGRRLQMLTPQSAAWSGHTRLCAALAQLGQSGQSPGSQQGSPRGQLPSQRTEALLWAASAWSWDLAAAAGLGVKQREAGRAHRELSCRVIPLGVKGNRDSETAWSPQPGSQGSAEKGCQPRAPASHPKPCPALGCLLGEKRAVKSQPSHLTECFRYIA